MRLPSWPSVQDPFFHTKGLVNPEKRLLSIREVLNVLGNPHKKLKNVIHVAGTNGKGSTSKAIHNILLESGLRSNLHISPHLLLYNERFILGTRQATDLEIEDAVAIVKGVVDKKVQINFFDITFIIGMVIFAQNSSDFNIIEVGLGGEFDATNVIEDKMMSVITSISLDHEETLGYSIDSISKNKAKIIKPQDVVFTSRQERSAITTIELEVAIMNATLFKEGRDWSCKVSKKTPKSFKYISKNSSLCSINNISTSYVTREQCQNASLAISACQYIQKKYPVITTETIRAGISSFKHECRFEFIKLPNFPKTEVLIDGAHNQNGVETLFRYIKKTRKKYAINIGIACILMAKDIDKIAGSISGLDQLFLVLPKELENFGLKKFYSPEDLEQRLLKLIKVPIAKLDQVEHVFKNINKEQKTRVVIFGSLFFAKIAKEHILLMSQGSNHDSNVASLNKLSDNT